MSTERQEKGKYLAYYQQVRKRGRNRGEIQIRENVLFRDSVRDGYTGLFSKRTLGNSELQDKLDKSGAHLSKVGGLLCRVGGASATLDPVQALDPISAPLCQHRTAPGGVGKQDWLNLRAEIAVTGFAHDPRWENLLILIADAFRQDVALVEIDLRRLLTAPYTTLRVGK